jgi:hypothetical protein
MIRRDLVEGQNGFPTRQVLVLFPFFNFADDRRRVLRAIPLQRCHQLSPGATFQEFLGDVTIPNLRRQAHHLLQMLPNLPAFRRWEKIREKQQGLAEAADADPQIVNRIGILGGCGEFDLLAELAEQLPALLKHEFTHGDGCVQNFALASTSGIS